MNLEKENEYEFFGADYISVVQVYINKCDILKKYLKKERITLENVAVYIENWFNEEQIQWPQFESDINELSKTTFTKIIYDVFNIKDLKDFVKENEASVNEQIDAVIYILDQFVGEPPRVFRWRFKNNSVRIQMTDLSQCDLDELADVCSSRIVQALDDGMGIQLLYEELSTKKLDKIIDNLS